MDKYGAEVAQIKKDSIQKDKRIENLELSLATHQQKTSSLGQQLLLIEVKERCFGLLIQGLPNEQQNESLESTVQNLFFFKTRNSIDSANLSVFVYRHANPM